MAHKPYKDHLQHDADFKVKYRFYTAEEGGRQTMPYQGYRSDFWYSHPEHNQTNQIFMIWPEFINEHGEIILDNEISVHASGIALMWVLDPEWRTSHIDNIKVGLIGYFMEGPRRVAMCEVIEVLDLGINPTKAR
ncbi:hypothetical protein [Pedobacter sp. MC2016-24]|uniref:hypothetical protein n=1 Tax=Pedobacter sp. MC2016-24 TaxID=2780090 RepID=UPI001881E287|nr:hypothetical protein [Pedobacter sp. MC2016-24]MBE9603151.1 hypothetical protein [Pedobacter sp. MC2016-24]